MKRSLKTPFPEVDALYRIREEILGLGAGPIDEADAEFLRMRADEGCPMAEHILGLHYLLERGEKEKAVGMFERFLKHANGGALFLACGDFALIYDMTHDLSWYDWSGRCLRRSAWRQFPIAKEMLKVIRANPFVANEA